MIQKKWAALMAGTILVAGCGSDNASPEEPAQQADAAPAETPAPAKEEIPAPEEAEAPIQQAEPDYRLNTANWSVEPIGDAPAQAVLLTIDDAPADHSVEMAETLKALGVPAIFFVNGHFLNSEEEKTNLKKIHEMGFAIGNHTYSHTNLKTIDDEQQREEILSLSETVEEIIGEAPEFFRAPNGTNTDFSTALVEAEGMLLMNWSYGYDWEKQYSNSAALTDIMVNTEFLRNGANLLMHDRAWTAQALPGIVKGLESKGYGFIDPVDIERAGK
ncbi:MAG TPA: polysaccharide deacetylase family protein [Planococcus sp. (in: firmicutes)]|nr:polysaccharide deacetylase family protein [Planococcus sp. (in: firmicutes)]